jgi:hypothetical protein
MAARTWTPEQRKRQAEEIRHWSPWKQSTGPKSEPGKALVARNGWKGGEWRKLREMVKTMNQATRRQKDTLK